MLRLHAPTESPAGDLYSDLAGSGRDFTRWIRVFLHGTHRIRLTRLRDYPADASPLLLPQRVSVRRMGRETGSSLREKKTRGAPMGADSAAV